MKSKPKPPVRINNTWLQVRVPRGLKAELQEFIEEQYPGQEVGFSEITRGLLFRYLNGEIEGDPLQWDQELQKEEKNIASWPRNA
jgi:hypothetical protein